MFYLTRSVEFCAGHRLHNPALSDQENRETYGPCNNPHGHGHNYVLEVTVRGEADPRTGMVMDLKGLKQVIHEEAVDRIDHRNLNEDVEGLRGVIPTTENLARWIWGRVAGRLPAGALYRVRLYESPRNVVDYFGEGEEGRP
ncbi:MAG: 6-carboxytetrahydropterin synthase [Planctomycetes bacterium]|nr:6-carboxytetrahydropterin synthase [Planctomycetota bacterium]